MLVAVVGPSGAGKDSLLAKAKQVLATDPRFFFVQRIITRPVDGTEQHCPVSDADFALMVARGHLALHWEAHGLSYGVPASALAATRRGRVVIANLSRATLSEAAAVFGALHVVEITAAPSVLAARLAGRGRESATAVAERLRRTVAVAADTRIDNDGPLEQGVGELLRTLQVLARKATTAA